MRIQEAAILLTAKKYVGAYYLAGYAVECGLKACIAKTVKRYDYPGKQLAQDCYTHDLKRLIEKLLAYRASPLKVSKWGFFRDFRDFR